MSRFRFYIDKIKFLATFIWWREWKLVREEWRVTYKERKENEAHSAEICAEAAARLLKLLNEEEE